MTGGKEIDRSQVMQGHVFEFSSQYINDFQEESALPSSVFMKDSACGVENERGSPNLSLFSLDA